METSLHQQLKEHYARKEDGIEVRMGEYIIDVVSGDELIEIQCASLGAIRDKIRKLTKKNSVRVVKPLAARKYLIKKKARGNQIISKRYSPQKLDWCDIFEELVHFTSAFPHPNLIFEIALIEIEEHRIAIKPKGWRKKNYKTKDRTLKSVLETKQLRTADDLWELLPGEPDGPFTTADLAKAANVPRWKAQKIAYCFRKTGTVEIVGKKQNSIIYLRKPASETEQAIA